MKKLPFLLVFSVLFSCLESDVEPFVQDEQSEPNPQDGAIDAYGVFYPGLDPYRIYCGPGWGDKFCRFLLKHSGTIWADPGNYHSEYPDIKFSKFLGNIYFISFLKLDSTTSYCNGWNLGETTLDGIKWNIEIVRDEEDVLWFDYDYYGANAEIEYTTTHKYEVIDGLLHFSTTDGQSFIFHPSEKDYSKDAVDTDEIIELEGCFFY